MEEPSTPSDLKSQGVHLHQRRTKIICTIGPASSSPEVFREMIRQGMNCARLNFSHGSYEDHAKNIKLIRSIAQGLDIPFAILQDLQGPKIRIGKLEQGQAVTLEKGKRITITTDSNFIGNVSKVSTSYQHLVKDTREGNLILIDDGLLQLKVISRHLNVSNSGFDEVTCEIIVGGKLGEKKGINLPHSDISAPALTEKDIKDLEFGLQQGVDYVCLSFVREAKDVTQCRDLMKKFNNVVPIISKIERQEAITNIDAILKESDGVMVARGDLAVEVSYYELAILQKKIISRSSALGKIDITATQMLASMCENPRPTRAEICDVSNSIFDGTDVLMMSNETAVGKYPIEAVQVMSEIASYADANYKQFSRLQGHESDSLANYMTNEVVDATTLAATTIAKKHTHVKLLACVTESGKTAVKLSQFRPPQKIIALTDSDKVYNQLALAWGVTPIKIEKFVSPEETESLIAQTLLLSGFAKEGDMIVIVFGSSSIYGVSNTVRTITLKK